MSRRWIIILTLITAALAWSALLIDALHSVTLPGVKDANKKVCIDNARKHAEFDAAQWPNAPQLKRYCDCIDTAFTLDRVETLQMFFGDLDPVSKNLRAAIATCTPPSTQQPSARP